MKAAGGLTRFWLGFAGRVFLALSDGSVLRRVQHLAGQTLGGEVHLFGHCVVDGYRAVFVQREGLWGRVAGLHLVGGELQPACADAEGDVVGGDFNDGVLGGVESVGGCVAAQY